MVKDEANNVPMLRQHIAALQKEAAGARCSSHRTLSFVIFVQSGSRSFQRCSPSAAMPRRRLLRAHSQRAISVIFLLQATQTEALKRTVREYERQLQQAKLSAEEDKLRAEADRQYAQKEVMIQRTA